VPGYSKANERDGLNECEEANDEIGEVNNEVDGANRESFDPQAAIVNTQNESDWMETESESMVGMRTAGLGESETMSTSNVSRNESQTGAGQLQIVNSCASSQRRCFICKSKDGRTCIPNIAVAQAWISSEVFVPKTNRCCKSHLNAKGEFNEAAMVVLKSIDNPIGVSGPNIFSLLQNVTELHNCKIGKMDFSDSGCLSDAHFKKLLGINKEQFSDLFKYSEESLKNSCNRKAKNALAMFLVKLRLDLPQELLGFFFDMESQPRVSDTLKSVSAALMDSFVPKYLGVNHITRSDYIRHHKSEFVQKLFEVEDDKLVAILDGTYVYIMKPSG